MGSVGGILIIWKHGILLDIVDVSESWIQICFYPENNYTLWNCIFLYRDLIPATMKIFGVISSPI